MPLHMGAATSASESEEGMSVPWKLKMLFCSGSARLREGNCPKNKNAIHY